MVFQIFAFVIFAGQAELSFERLGRHPNPHRRNLVGRLQHGVPEDNIAVEPLEARIVGRGPVVVVGRTTVVRLAVRELTPDTDNKDRPILLRHTVLTLLGGQGRVFPGQLFGVEEGNLLGQNRRNVRIAFVGVGLDFAQDTVYRADNLLQEGQVTLLGAHGTLPVPLVHVQRVEVVQLFVGADGVHVGIEAVARGNAVFGQFEPFPLGQRVDHFGTCLTHILNGESHGPFGSVQVVVDTCAREHEERCRHPTQVQLLCQSPLESVFEHFDGLLGGLGVECRTVGDRQGECHGQKRIIG